MHVKSVEWCTLCAHDQDGTTSTSEKGKTLFKGLYIIWIISQNQQQQLCLILLHRTYKNNTLIFNIYKLSVQFSFNKSVVILLACVFCWVLLCNTTRLFYLLYYLFISFCAQKNYFFLDLLLPVVYLLFNVHNCLFKLYMCTDWRGLFCLINV